MANEPKDDLRAPGLASDSAIHRLFGDDFASLRATAAAIDRVNELMRPALNAETIFSARRRKMIYDRIPVGHDIGYRCYDGDKHDAESAYEAGEFGDGLSENEAYVAWLHAMDDLEPAPPPRMRLIDGGGGVQPPEYADDYQDPDAD